METLASLKLKIDSSEAAPAAMGLDKLTAAGAKAEGQLKQTASATSTLAKEEGRAASASDTLAKTIRDQEEALRRSTASAAGLSAAHAKVAAAGKVTTTEMLNLSRQFADIGVTAAMGMSPLMILIQQGPQIADVFATASARGVGFSAVLKDIAVSGWAAVAPFAPFIAGAAAIAAVVGGGLLVATHELNQENKNLANSLGLTHDQLERVKNKGITVGDVLSGTFKTVGDSLKSAFAPQLSWLSKAFEASMSFIAKLMVDTAKFTLGAFIGSYNAITQTWKMLPAAMGDAAISAVNLVISALEGMINKAINAIDKIIAGTNEIMGRAGLGFQLPMLDPVNIAKLADPFAGAMKRVGEVGAKALNDGMKSASVTVDGLLATNTANILGAYKKRVTGEAGKDKSSGSSGSGSTAQGQTDDSAQRMAALDAQLAQAKAAELQAQLSIVREASARADLEHQILQAQVQAKAAQLEKQKIEIDADKGISDQKKSLLKAKVDEIAWAEVAVASAQAQAIDAKAVEALQKEAVRRREATVQNQIDLLSSEAATKEFAFQRLPIEQHILQLQTQLERIKLEEIINSRASTANEKAIAQAKLNTLEAVNANKLRAAVGGVLDNFNAMASATSNFASAFKNHNWSGILSGLDQMLTQAKAAFGPGGTTGSKIGAVAGVGQAVGSAIGGTTGSTISGMASGAMAGFTLGGPMGAAIGAVVGGIAGLLSGNKAAKDAKNQAAIEAYQKEAARLAQVSADKRALEIQMMELSGDKVGALAARRQDELNAMDASNRAIAQQIYALQDAKDAQDALNAKLAVFNQTYLTNVENLVATQTEVASVFAKLGVSGVLTKDQFKALVLGIDKTTASGAALYSALLDIAPAFAKVADAASEAADKMLATAKDSLEQAISDVISAYNSQVAVIQKTIATAKSQADAARDGLVTSYNREASALKNLVSKWSDFSRALKDFRKTLNIGPLANLSPESTYTTAKAIYEATLSAAKSGDQTAIGSLADAAATFLNASRDYFASSGGYNADLEAVKQAVDSVTAVADQKGTEAQAQLTALNNLMDGLDGVIDGVAHLGDQILTLNDGIFTVNDSILSIGEAIASYQAATSNYDMVKAAADEQLTALNDLMDGLDGVKDGIVHLGDKTLVL
ncbi:MAG: phage tail length tape measure family protein, partial [Alphaproteobacteria bacterium]